MDGNPATPPLGFDAECLDPASTPANNKKDYIAIPFASVTDVSVTPMTIRYHNLFCLDSLQDKDVECKIIFKNDCVYPNNFNLRS